MNTITIEKAAETATSTKTYLLEKDQFLIAQAYWKAAPAHSAWQHIGYNLLRGFTPDRGFIPLQSTNKIASNNCDAWNGYNQALRTFKGLITIAAPTKYGYTEEKCVTINAQRKADFHNTFGIELTEAIREAGHSLEKK